MQAAERAAQCERGLRRPVGAMQPMQIIRKQSFWGLGATRPGGMHCYGHAAHAEHLKRSCWGLGAT